jgi:CRP-like cAMP-binding protein
MSVPSDHTVPDSSAPLLPLGKTIRETEGLDQQAILERWNWLSFHRLWGLLGDESLPAIASSLHLLTVEPGTEIYRQDQTAIGLYLLKWGSVEIYRQSPVGRTHIRYRSAGDLFGYVPLVEASAKATYQAGAIALTKSEIWFLQQADFERLIHAHPEIQTLMNRLLAQDLAQFARRISWEQARIQGLQRYIQSIPLDEPLIGHSKAAQKIAQQVEAVATNLQAIVLQAGSGTGKTFLAEYIHRRSGLSHYPFAELDCAQLPRDAAGVVQSQAL